MEKRSVLCILRCLLIILPVCTTQECRKVTSMKSVCLTTDPTSTNITCPSGYKVTIVTASFVKSRFQGCSSQVQPSADTCQIRDVTSEVRDQCYRALSTDINDILSPQVQNSCLVNFENLTNSENESQCTENYPGDKYITIYYSCDGLFSANLTGTAWAISMCENSTYKSSLLNINNNMLFFDNDTQSIAYTYKYGDCRCAFLVPANTGLEMKSVLFYTRPSSPPCSQRVNVAERGGGANFTFCPNQKVPVQLSCAPTDKIYDVIYDTDDESVGSLFIIELKVNYQAEMRIVCGPTFFHEQNSLQITQTSSATLPFTPPISTTTTTATTVATTLPVTPPITTTTTTATTVATTLSVTPPITTTTTTATTVASTISVTTPISIRSATSSPPTATTTSKSATSTSFRSSTKSSTQPTTISQTESANMDEMSTRSSDEPSLISNAALIGLIAGCLLAVILIIALITSIAYIKCTKAKAKGRAQPSHHTRLRSPDRYQPRIDETLPHRPIYVTDMYLEGSSPSHFVIERPPYHSPYSPYLRY